MFKVAIDTRHAVLHERELITSGSAGLTIEFVFSEDWNGLSKTAVFSDGCITRDVILTGDTCDIPHECMRFPYNNLIVGVYGSDGVKIAIPTVYCKLGEILKGADPCGDPSIPLTPTVEQQLMARIQDHEERILYLEEHRNDRPYLSIEREDRYLYKVTFEKLPEEKETGFAPAMCSSYVQNGKLYRHLDWNYDSNASFHIVCPHFEGMSFLSGLTDTELNDALISQLPYRIVDGVNEYGIMVSTHVLYNDWNAYGHGEIPLTKLPYLALNNVKSMATIETDLQGILTNLITPPAMVAMEYLIQVLVTDGITAYVLRPGSAPDESYEAVDISSNPKLSNFRWVPDETVYRQELQLRPTGVERWNMMPCDLHDLRFTKCYEEPTRLSEFIGLRGTTKDSSDSELLEIYNISHGLYQNRTRDGTLWQTMHSVVYSKRGIEHLWVQENWEKDYGNRLDLQDRINLLEEKVEELEMVIKDKSYLHT